MNDTPASSTTTTASLGAVTTASTVKPGWQTSEFYLALAAKILSGLFAFGIVGDGSTISRLAGVAAFVLTQLGYTVSRTMIKTAAMLVLVMFAFHSTGCATASGRQKTLASTLAGINGAELSLVAFDQSWQDKIIADCRDDSTCTEAIGAARLADAQAKLDTVSKAITAAYKLIGQAFVLDDDSLAANAVAAAAVIVVQLHALGIK